MGTIQWTDYDKVHGKDGVKYVQARTWGRYSGVSIRECVGTIQWCVYGVHGDDRVVCV